MLTPLFFTLSMLAQPQTDSLVILSTNLPKPLIKKIAKGFETPDAKEMREPILYTSTANPAIRAQVEKSFDAETSAYIWKGLEQENRFQFPKKQPFGQFVLVSLRLYPSSVTNGLHSVGGLRLATIGNKHIGAHTSGAVLLPASGDSKAGFQMLISNPTSDWYYIAQDSAGAVRTRSSDAGYNQHVEALHRKNPTNPRLCSLEEMEAAGVAR